MATIINTTGSFLLTGQSAILHAYAPVPLPAEILVADFQMPDKVIEFKIIPKQIKTRTELR